MVMTDNVADMITRIRNAQHRQDESVDIPHSNMKEEMCQKLSETGFILDYKRIAKDPQPILRAFLKYADDGEPVIRSVERVSKPGRRRYLGSDEIDPVKNGLGIALLTTPDGVLTGREARENNVGGEILCEVW